MPALEEEEAPVQVACLKHTTSCRELRSDSRIEEKVSTKRKGGFSCEKPPFLRFFEDLVRFPDHNMVIPKTLLSRKRGPRFSSLFRYSSL